MMPDAVITHGDSPKVAPLFCPDESVGFEADLLQAWVTDYLCQPHPDLGRDGPVCPLTRPSLEKRLFWACYDERADLDVADICALARDVRRRFHDLPPTSGPDAMLRAVLIVFPKLSNYDVVDAAQKQLKTEFVEDALMIGQFYPGCQESGLWNSEFRPLESPLPLLAIRHMVSNDFPFLDSRPEWIGAYLRKFAPSIPSPIRARLAFKVTDPV